MTNKKLIVWFEEVNKNDVNFVGGKGANLGEMTNASFPIPYGFIVTANAYFDFIKEAKLEKKIKDLLSVVNFENPYELKQASSHIRELINQAPIPKTISEKIINYYENLNMKEEQYLRKKLTTFDYAFFKLKSIYKFPLVAVRSSATAEDLPSASFAGQQETYLNIQGENNLLLRIKKCWASLFTERAIYYRHQLNFDHFKVGLAVVVQRMVQSEKSGIAFTVDPVTNDKNRIIIEAILGLGEYIVGGRVSPDHYEVDKRSLVILKKEIKNQSVKLVKSGIKNKEVKLSKKEALSQKLTDEEIIKIALLVSDIEKHYYFPQDIEWAIEKERIFIVQSRPITTIGQIENKISKDKLKISPPTGGVELGSPILIGAPASPGVGVGPVKIVFAPSEINKIKPGDVLVAPSTNPDYVPAMKKACAIVTEKGGRTSH
ncbi:MAG: PEP/pyruvate-binding domain-containing protein, partial [Microgenomates group bacterium]